MSKSISSRSEVDENRKKFFKEVLIYQNYISILETFSDNNFKIPEAKVEQFNEYDLLNIFANRINLVTLIRDKSTPDLSKFQDYDRIKIVFIHAQNWLTHYYFDLHDNQDIPYSQYALHQKLKGTSKDALDACTRKLEEGLNTLRRVSQSFRERLNKQRVTVRTRHDVVGTADQSWQAYILIAEWKDYQFSYQYEEYNSKVLAAPLFIEFMDYLCLETETVPTKKKSTSKQQQSTSSEQQSPSKQQQSTSNQQQSTNSKKKQIHIPDSEDEGEIDEEEEEEEDEDEEVEEDAEKTALVTEKKNKKQQSTSSKVAAAAVEKDTKIANQSPNIPTLKVQRKRR